MKKKCFLCATEDSLLDFESETLWNCFMKLWFRREKNFAYREVRLCLNSIEKYGYHSSCYKRVTVLSKKYSDEYAEFCKNNAAPTSLTDLEQKMATSSSQNTTCEDTLIAVTNNVMDQDWKTKGGSIWHHNQERSEVRVKCRATTCQLVQLVKFMEQHKELAVSHQKPLPGSTKLWEQLAEHINQFGPPKTALQCKTTWRDLRKRAFAMMRGNSRPPSRALYGMAPQIIRLVEEAGGLPPKVANLISKPGGLKEAMRSLGSVSSESSNNQVSSSEAPATDPLADATSPPTVKVEKTSSGDQLIIRVTDKLDSKTNVLNRFSVRDGHFENNVIVKEEKEDPQPEEEPENMETEERPASAQSEVMFPAAEAILGNQSDDADRNRAIDELNATLRKLVGEYAERTQLMRESLELKRARLQFDMQVFNSRQKPDEGS